MSRYKAIVEMFNGHVVQTRVRPHDANEIGIGFPDGHTCIFKVAGNERDAESIAANLREWLKSHLADNGVAFSLDGSVFRKP